MDRHDRIEQRLAEVPLFAGLSRRELTRIAGLATYLEEPAGTVLIARGATGKEFIIVLDGRVEVRRGDSVIAERGSGDFFGEIALLDDRPRTATVVAVTPVQIEVINRGEFKELLREVPEMAATLMTTMAQRLVDLEGDPADR
jgi:CRP-like cAMP-binding protein